MLNIQKQSCILILFIVLILSINSQQSKFNLNNTQQTIDQSFPFQRIIWSYWNSTSNQLPLIVQLCLQNLQLLAKNNNFTFILLNQSNIRNYIKDYDKLFTQVRKKSVQTSYSQMADLIRLLVTQQNGGIWVDATVIFPNSFTQILNIANKQYSHLITNRFTSHPQCLMFYLSAGQNRIESFIKNPKNKKQTILYNQYPDFEAWSIFAKKNSSLLSDIRKKYSQFTVKQFEQVQNMFVEQDFLLHQIDNGGIYLYINMAITYVLQHKQKQLDKQLTLLGQRQIVFDYYKFWGLHSQLGPMVALRQDLFPLQYFFTHTRQQLQAKGFKFRFFMKQTGSFRELTDKKFKALKQSFQDNNKTFQDFMMSKPSIQTCQQLIFVVQGSIIGQLIRNSTVSKKHKIPIITKQQNKQYEKYCDGKLPLKSKVLAHLQNYKKTWTVYEQRYYQVNRAKIESIIHSKEQLNIIKQLQFFYKDNKFIVADLLYLLMVLLFMRWTYNILESKLLNLFSQLVSNNLVDQRKNKIQTENQKRNDSQVEISNTNNNYKQSKQIIYNLINETKNQFKLYYFLLYSVLLINMLMYTLVDFLGGRQQPLTIFVVVLMTFIVQSLIQRKIQNQSLNNRLFKNQYQLFYIMINYLVGYLVLTYFFRNKYWLYWYSQVLCMLAPCVFKINNILQNDMNKKQVIQKQQANRRYQLNIIKKLINNNKHRVIVLIWMSVQIMIPNIKYLTNGQHYYVFYIPLIILVYVAIVYVKVLFKCIKRELKYETIKLIMLGLLSIILHLDIIKYSMYIIHKNHYLSYNIMCMIISSTIYIQMGSQIHFNCINYVKLNKQSVFPISSSQSNNFDEYQLNKNKFNLIVYIAPLIGQILIGIVILNHSDNTNGYHNYWLHYMFFIYNITITILYSVLQQQSSTQYQSIDKQSQPYSPHQQLQTIQMD